MKGRRIEDGFAGVVTHKCRIGKQMAMRIIIAAGGTGGHIYPGIAVANEVMRRDSESEVLFVGTARGLETRIVPESGFQLALIRSAGLKNVGLLGKIRGGLLLPTSFAEAWKVIRDFKPDVVVGAGGYVSGPVVLTAHFMGRRTMVMDSNALPGFTNRQLARFVDRAALTFDEAAAYFGKKAVVTGNPVRSEFFEVKHRNAVKPLNILVFGGSQGSRAINNAVTSSLPILRERSVEAAFVHQTGDADLADVATAYTEAGIADADVRPYITNMVEAFDKADLIICRAGATTCAEVAAAGKAAIMIPLPTAADDHQRRNAEALERQGAARMVLQDDLSGESLASVIEEFDADPSKIDKMAIEARKMARSDAAEAAVDIISELAER